MFTLLAQAADDSFFGTVTAPAAIQAYGENGGLVTLGNNIIIFAVIVGGLIALANIIMAGYIYLTAAGDAKAHEKVVSKITMSLWGMAIMILAPAMMAIVGFLFFKDSTFFLQPKIVGVEVTGSPTSPTGGTLPTAPPGPCQVGPWNNYICP